MFCKNSSKILEITSPQNDSKREFSQETSRVTGVLVLQEIAIDQENDESLQLEDAMVPRNSYIISSDHT